MLLWISFALLAAAVATLLMRATFIEIAPTAHDPDLAVYRDQITELETDTERGVIDRQQAAAARIEIARRLIKQAAPKIIVASTPMLPGWVLEWSPGLLGRVLLLLRDRLPWSAFTPERVLLGASALVPLASLALYLAVGSPYLPDRPLAVRLAEAPEKSAPNDMIAKVEARLREKPDDGQGWAVIAPVYLSQGRAPDAAMAFARAINLVGETPERLLGLAKSNILANNGTVNEPARKAFQRLLELDPSRIEAKYWLAVYEEQNGRPDAAAAAYLALLASGPADAPWRKPVEERLAAVTSKSGGPVPGNLADNGIRPPVLAPAAGGTSSSKGPTPAEFVAAAQKLAPEMREQMIGRMVAKAGDAIKINSKDVAAWSRLVTGHAALGRSADAQTALKDARQALAGDASALTELEALGKSLGFSS